MLEITSPGPLPDVIPLEKLGSGRSEIRNPILAPIFKDMGLIEAWGTGILKMQKEVSTNPDIELVFQEPGHAFQVQFKKTRIEQENDELRESQGRVRAESQREGGRAHSIKGP